MSIDDKSTTITPRGGKRAGAGRPKGAKDANPRRRFGKATTPTVVISVRVPSELAAEFAALARKLRRKPAELLAELIRERINAA